MQALGKRTLKRYLECFLPLLLEAVADTDRRSRAWAAGDVIATVRRDIGATIFAGRLTPAQRELVASSEAVPKDAATPTSPASSPGAGHGGGAGAGAAGMGMSSSNLRAGAVTR